MNEELPEHGLSEATVPTAELHDFAKSELACLKDLTSKRCKSTPKLYGSVLGRQSIEDPVPNGYILYLLLQRLPGIPLNRWSNSPGKKNEEITVRAALKAAIKLVNGLRLMWKHSTLRIIGLWKAVTGAT